MRNKREWTETEKQGLISYISKFKDEGMSIKNAAINFSKEYPHITPSQARVYYYKLINETENFRKKYSQRVWTEEEKEIVIQTMDDLKGVKRKIEIFNILSDKLDRHPKAIASHYYSIKQKNDSSRLNSKKSLDFENNISSKDLRNIFLKMEKIEEVYQKALDFECILQKETIIYKLNKELEEAREKIKLLEMRLMVS